MMSKSLILLLISIATYIVKIENREIDINERQEFRPDFIYDFIVVGSGSAGAIVAHRLAESKQHVLLIEAGPYDGFQNKIPLEYVNLLNSKYDWNYTMSPQFVGKGHKNNSIDENRGRVLGGSSSINGMVFNRGNRLDFNRWESEFGAKGWDYEKVLPFSKKYENNTDPTINGNGFHGTDGPIQITTWTDPDKIMLLHQKALNEMGYQTIDINGPEQFGTAIAQATIDTKGVRSSTANAYLRPNPFPKYLHIIVESFVTKILFDENTAIGVQVIKDGKCYDVKAYKEIIVSAGAINSPQLLMLSGIGPQKHLDKFNIPLVMDLPVGEHLQNHPGLNINFLIKDEYQNLSKSGDPEMTEEKLQEYNDKNSGELTKYYNSFTYLSTNDSNKEWPNIAMESVILKFPKLFKDFTIFSFDKRDEWEVYYSQFLAKKYVYAQSVLELTRSEGYVRLLSRDPLVYPDINPRFLTDQTDYDDLHKMVKLMFKFYERSSFAPYVEPHRPIPGCRFCANQTFVYECDSYISCLLEQILITGYHPVGTCRMGDVNRNDTVVDPRLRVKGIDRLRVCDASIMPLVTNGNTNAPSMMIGEKCSHIIKEDNHLIPD